WSGSSAAFGDNSAGSWHGTHTCGTICGDDSYVSGTSAADGMAIKAKMYFMDIGTSSGSLSVPGDLTNLYTLPFNGNTGGAARVSSHSWGSTTGAGTYTAYCQQTDRFMWDHKDFLIVYAAGNNGPGATTVIPPGTSKDILTAGAVANGTSANQMADFSSRGPCNDTRYKPTVTAPGQNMLSSIGSTATSYGYMQGTSMATPCVGGNAALVRDYFAKGFYPTGESVPGNRMTYISAALVKACIVNSAAPDIIGSTIPDNNTGWGRVNIDDVLYFKDDVRKLSILDDTTGLSTGQYREFTVTVNNQSEPLKITLVWTDYPASSGANPAIVNNLDLVVTGPNAVVYKGNQYTGGQSTPNPAGTDTRNVEECVRRNVPELGEWTIRVNATNVPQGTRQPFAVVVSGGLGTAGTAVLSLSGSRLEDPPPGNNNGRFDPGETVYLTDTLRNLSGVAVTGVTGKVRLLGSNPYITLLDTVGTFGDIPVGGTAHNGASRFRLSASSATPPGTVVEFVLALSGSGFSQNIPFELKVGASGFQVVWGPKQLPSFPSTGFNYGLAYNPVNQRLYVMNAYSRRIYIYSSDSSLTYYGNIPAPDTMGTDIKYCAYDSTFWVATNPITTGRKKVSKIQPDGTVLWQFDNLANDYPVGLAWVESEYRLYLSDRRTALNSFPQYVYVADTLGTQVRRMDVPLRAAYGARCLAYEPQGPNNGSLLMVYTAFNSGGTQIDSCGVYEMSRTDLSIIQRVLLPGWNCRGIEYDPRDGNYWVTIPQSPDRSIAKISGFYGPPTGLVSPGTAPVAERLRLLPIRPNPCPDQAELSYYLPSNCRVRLSVCDLTGRVVARVVDEVQEPGLKRVRWNGQAEDGGRLSSGIYFCRLEALDQAVVGRFVLVR
ncbi:MAG: S8 family serine peptidase, partial [candidate division WOR-3 bacterium]